MATIAAFMEWLTADLGRGISLCNHIETVSSPQLIAQGKAVLRLYTESSCYEITAENGGRIGGSSRLAAIVTARKPRAGERQPRSRPLTSGAITPETWRLILGDIVACELVRLHASPLDPEPARAAMAASQAATVTAAQARPRRAPAPGRGGAHR